MEKLHLGPFKTQQLIHLMVDSQSRETILATTPNLFGLLVFNRRIQTPLKIHCEAAAWHIQTLSVGIFHPIWDDEPNQWTRTFTGSCLVVAPNTVDTMVWFVVGIHLPYLVELTFFRCFQLLQKKPPPKNPSKTFQIISVQERRYHDFQCRKCLIQEAGTMLHLGHVSAPHRGARRDF